MSETQKNVNKNQHYGYNGGENQILPDDFMPDDKRLQPAEVCSRVIDALATGRELHIASSQMPAVAISEDSRPLLAQRWANDLACVAAGASLVAPAPKNWEEAKAHIPDLKSWAEYKATNPDRSIVDYLADPDGLGRWALVEPGIPRPALKKLYPIIDARRPEVGSPYKALENWLGRTNKETGKRNQIPPSIHIPDISTEIDRLAALAQTPGDQPLHVHRALRSRAWRVKINERD